MKGLGRVYVWWPRVNDNIKNAVDQCAACHMCQEPPSTCGIAAVALAQWTFNVDFTGPFMGRMNLILRDAYSKWLQVLVMKSTTNKKILEALRTCLVLETLNT